MRISETRRKNINNKKNQKNQKNREMEREREPANKIKETAKQNTTKMEEEEYDRRHKKIKTEGA